MIINGALTTPAKMKWWWPPQGTNGRLVIETLGRLIVFSFMTPVIFWADSTTPLWALAIFIPFSLFMIVLICLYAYGHFNWSDDKPVWIDE